MTWAKFKWSPSPTHQRLMWRNSEAQYWRERKGELTSKRTGNNTESRHWSRIWHLKCWDGATIHWTEDQRRNNVENTLSLRISKSPWDDIRHTGTIPVWSRRRCDCLPYWDAIMLGDANWRVGRDQRIPGTYCAARSTTLVSCGNNGEILKQRVTGENNWPQPLGSTHACTPMHVYPYMCTQIYTKGKRSKKMQ